MEKIKGANRKLIQNAVDFARKFMKIPDCILKIVHLNDFLMKTMRLREK